jgi:hypothetical protein
MKTSEGKYALRSKFLRDAGLGNALNAAPRPPRLVELSAFGTLQVLRYIVLHFQMLNQQLLN